MQDNEIFISDNHFNQGPSLIRRLWENKILRIGVAVVIVAELIWGGYTLTRPVSDGGLGTGNNLVGANVTPTPKVSAKLSVIGPTVPVKSGDSFDVSFKIDSPVSTDGSDLIIKYDPKVLDVIPGPSGPMKIGTYYPGSATNGIDVPGVIAVSLIIDPGAKASVGAGTLGTVTFKAKTAGNTQISLDFVSGKTNESNITSSETGKDILDRVENLNLIVQ